MLPAAGGSQPCPQVEAERPKGLNITVSSWQRYEATTLHQTPLKKAVILPLKTKVWLAFVLPRCCQQCFFSECLFVKRGAGLPKGAGLWKGAGFQRENEGGAETLQWEKNFIIVSIIIVWMCVWSGGGASIRGKGAGLTLIHINQPKQSWAESSVQRHCVGSFPNKNLSLR